MLFLGSGLKLALNLRGIIRRREVLKAHGACSSQSATVNRVRRRTFPAVFTFAKEVRQPLSPQPAPSLATPGLGACGHVQGHNYSAVNDAFVFSPDGVWIQTNRLTRAIEVSIDGTRSLIKLPLIFDTNGHVIVTGCARASRVARISAERLWERKAMRSMKGRGGSPFRSHVDRQGFRSVVDQIFTNISQT